MKILHLTYGFGMGGIETMLVNISRCQVAQGHQVEILVLNDIVDASLVERLDPGVTLTLLGRPVGSRNPLHILNLNRRLMMSGAEVIHLHQASLARYVVLPQLRRRLCVTIHAMCRPAIVAGIEKAGPVFAISEMVRKDIEDKTGIKAVTVVNGINTAEIQRRNPAKRPGAQFRIVQVGRLDHKVKGQDILLRAVAMLADEGRNVKLTLIGDGPSLLYLRELSQNLGIGGIVEFLGTQSQTYVFRHLKEYDLMVLPSRIEGFGLAVAEGMAAGLPVLAADHSGPLEITDNGRHGFHFKKDEAHDCARRIAALIDSYPTADFLEAAARRAVEAFDVTSTANRYLELYSSIVSVSREG